MDLSSGCNEKLFERKIDVCRIAGSLSSDPFLSLLINAVEKAIGKKLKCPILPGCMQMNDLKFDMPIPMRSGISACIRINCIVKTDKSKNYQKGFISYTNATYYWG
jgi:hypothetical protein